MVSTLRSSTASIRGKRDVATVASRLQKTHLDAVQIKLNHYKVDFYLAWSLVCLEGVMQSNLLCMSSAGYLIRCALKCCQRPSQKWDAESCRFAQASGF